VAADLPAARTGTAPFAIAEELEMTRKIIALTMLITGLALTGCKYESMSAFDNNCSGNGGLRNEALCEEHFLK
jgi:hypothetical protein